MVNGNGRVWMFGWMIDLLLIINDLLMMIISWNVQCFKKSLNLRKGNFFFLEVSFSDIEHGSEKL